MNREQQGERSQKMDEPREFQGEQFVQNNSELATNEWITVVQAARLLNLTPRAVQKRCQTGKYTTRRVRTPKGEAWEIFHASLSVSPNLIEWHDEPRESQAINQAELGAPISANLSELVRSVPVQEWKEREAELKEEIHFLRGLVEGHQRSEAELRAALREALKAMPKALDLGTQTVSEPPVKEVEVVVAAKPTELVKPSVFISERGAQPVKEVRPLWKLILGVR